MVQNVRKILGKMIKSCILLLVFGMAFPAFAYTSCVGGTVITRNQMGSAPDGVNCTAEKCPVTTTPKTFCQSNNMMNWWSAFTWCEANGGSLATFASMCPNVAPESNIGGGPCPAMQNTGRGTWSWSSTGVNSSNSMAVALTHGGVYKLNRDYVSAYAVCE